MILIVGGAFQGKSDFALKNLGLEKGKIFDNFHIAVKECLEKGRDTGELMDRIFSQGYCAIISNELGCGIVPIDKNDCLWREETGRALCIAAQRCNQVWRVQCGIGVRIK